MLSRQFDADRSGSLPSLAAEAVTIGRQDRFQTIYSLIPLVTAARQAALGVLNTAGVEDPTLPSAEEEALLNASGVRDISLAGLTTSSKFMHSLATGFVEAAFIVHHRENQKTPEERNSENEDRQLLAIADAWIAVEGIFSTPYEESLLRDVDGEASPEQSEEQVVPAYIALFRRAIDSQRTKQVHERHLRRVAPVDLTAADERRPDVEEVKAIFRTLLRLRDIGVGPAIRLLRTSPDVYETQGELAHDVYRSVSYVSAVERRQINPSLGAFFEIAEALLRAESEQGDSGQ